MRDCVDTNISIDQEKQKRRHDSGRVPAVVYKKGNLVKISRTNFHNKGNSSKLLSKFIGPYRIVNCLGNDRYKITDIPGFNRKRKPFESVVAADRVRPWINTKVAEISSESSNNSSNNEDSDDNLPLSILRQRKQTGNN